MLAKARWESHIERVLKSLPTTSTSPGDHPKSKILVDLDKIKRKFSLSWPFSIFPIVRLSNFYHSATTLKFFRNSLKSGIILDLSRGNRTVLTNLHLLPRGKRVKKGRLHYTGPAEPRPKQLVLDLPFPVSIDEFRGLTKLGSPVLVSSELELLQYIRQNRYSTCLEFILNLDWECKSTLWKLDYSQLFRAINGHRIGGIFLSSSSSDSSIKEIILSSPQQFKSKMKRRRKRLTFTRFRKVILQLRKVISKIQKFRERNDDFHSVILGHPFTLDLLCGDGSSKNQKQKSSTNRESQLQVRSSIENIIQNVLLSSTQSFCPRKLTIMAEVCPAFLSDCVCCVSRITGIQTAHYSFEHFQYNHWSSSDEEEIHGELGENENLENTRQRRRFLMDRKYYSYEISEGVCSNFGLSSPAYISSSSTSLPKIGSLKVEKVPMDVMNVSEESKDDRKKKEKDLGVYITDIIGPSRNVEDVLSRKVMLPKLGVGDMIYFPEFGAVYFQARKKIVGFKDLETFHLSGGERVDF